MFAGAYLVEKNGWNAFSLMQWEKRAREVAFDF